MLTEPRTPRLAILIDAENTSARIAPGLFQEIAKIGEASVRRIYGDFSRTNLKPWTDILAAHAIMPHQNFAYTTGKNASDIALVIDAMDLLHSGRLDGFCLVSSDSDFTRLAARIREQGLDVYGFGEQKTPESFVRACRRFVYTENLLPIAHCSERSAALPKLALKPLSAAAKVLRMAIMQLDDKDGWVHLAQVGARLLTLASDFDPRSYGRSKLIDLVEATGSFEVQRKDAGEVQIRLKPATAVPVARNAQPPLKAVSK